MFFRTIVVFGCVLAILGCGGSSKTLSEAEQKAANEKMAKEMESMKMQLPAKLPNSKTPTMPANPGGPPK